jgi:transposase
MEQTAQEHEHEIVYFVNGEEQRARHHKRTVREILEDAGFKPVKEYQLTRDSDGHTYEHEETEVHLKDGERFTATFIGPTPTS